MKRRDYLCTKNEEALVYLLNVDVFAYSILFTAEDLLDTFISALDDRLLTGKIKLIKKDNHLYYFFIKDILSRTRCGR